MTRLPKFLSAPLSFYSPGYLSGLVYLLEQNRYRTLRYMRTYWSTQDFRVLDGKRPTSTVRNRSLLLFIALGSLLQLVIGIGTLAYGLHEDLVEATPFGLAIILSYPVVWAHLLAIAEIGYRFALALSDPKQAGRAVVCAVLERQVVRLRRRHNFTLVAVAGSIGKTSTKLAIAHTLETSRRVIYQSGNYNDRVTVPLVIFGQDLPNLLNVLAWLRIFIANERAIRRPKFYDIAVVEIGTDHPGDMAHFAYLRPDITVVTAITPEHMEYFGTLDAVAAEELTVCDYSKQVLVNADDTLHEYLKDRDVLSFGTAKHADFRATDIKADGLAGSTARLTLQEDMRLDATAEILGKQGVKILLAAAAAAQLAGLNKAEIEKGIREVKPFAGRMQILRGIRGTTIIDDTYNASPAPIMAALDVLYAADAPQRLAVLGNMNELGDYSQQAHREVGQYCDPAKLDLVITIGLDAKKYLAPAATNAGCTVMCFDSPYAAGEAVRKHLKKAAVVLAEGSQNGVFAEESLKVLLADRADVKRLVRQSAYWMGIKRAQFSDAPSDDPNSVG